MTGTARTAQPKTVTRAVPTGSRCYYLGHTITSGQRSVCFAIGGRRYEYALTPQQLESVEHLCRRISPLKGLNYAKRKGRVITTATATISGPTTSTDTSPN